MYKQGSAIPCDPSDVVLPPRLEALLYNAKRNPPEPRCVEARRDGKAYVYFIGGDDTPIKVGFSGAPHERLASLQTAHWAKLSILAKIEGTLATELEYHRRFSAHRLAGEWFTRCPEIEAEIALLNAKADAA